MNIFRSQGGFSAIIVIVLIVLFALIGGYMATLTSVSAVSTATSAAGIQAWFAARSGMEWAIHRSLDLQTCTGVHGQTLNLSGGGLAGFGAQISCDDTHSGIIEGPDTYNIYNIGVTASRGTPGQETYVSRRVTVTITDRNAP
jgi:MSHA biogenesis protein MshP